MADCGTTHFTDKMIKDTLKERLPGHSEIDEISTFGGINEYVPNPHFLSFPRLISAV